MEIRQMVYQTFPWQTGDSNSIQKLCSLFLPELKNKKVLDVGCNNGFFCGWAKYKKAAYVKGIDINETFLAEARLLFPDCVFQCGDWFNLDETKYDVILFLSAIHYAQDQQATLNFLMEHLEPGGVLVLEIGVCREKAGRNEFVLVDRGIDKRYFPTWARLQNMLNNYVYKLVGESVNQQGDPVPRYVFHIQHKKPVAVLLIGLPGSGKTTLAKSVFKDNLLYISGDALLNGIRNNQIKADAQFTSFLQTLPFSGSDLAPVIHAICKKNMLQYFAQAVAEQAQNKSFIFDGYIPQEYHLQFISYFHKHNFYVAGFNIFSGKLQGDRSNTIPDNEIREYLIQLMYKKSLLR